MKEFVVRSLRAIGLEAHAVVNGIVIQKRGSTPWHVELAAFESLHGEKVKQIMTTLRVSDVMDVGANVGQYGSWIRKLGFTGEIHSFEPVPDVYDRLAQVAKDDPKWHTFNIALSSKAGTAKLNILEEAVLASLGQPSKLAHELFQGRAAARGSIDVTLDTLSNYVASVGNNLSNARMMVKLDTQGHDMSVLEGCDISDKRLVAISCELSFRSLYEGAPLAHEMLGFMNRAGFTPVGFYPIMPPRTDQLALVEADCLFVRA